jgi:hypothetical protein
LTGYDSWEPAEFLIDTGADRPVFSASLLAVLHLQAAVSQHRLGGVGGLADAVVVETQIRFNHEEGRKVVFRGPYAAVTNLEILDISVLGRDIARLFAVIIDQPGAIVCLLGQRHQYTIVQR